MELDGASGGSRNQGLLGRENSWEKGVGGICSLPGSATGRESVGEAGGWVGNRDGLGWVGKVWHTAEYHMVPYAEPVRVRERLINSLIDWLEIELLMPAYQSLLSVQKSVHVYFSYSACTLVWLGAKRRNVPWSLDGALMTSSTF